MSFREVIALLIDLSIGIILRLLLIVAVICFIRAIVGLLASGYIQ